MRTPISASRRSGWTLLEQDERPTAGWCQITITPVKTAEDALTASGIKATIQQKDHAKAAGVYRDETGWGHV